MLIMLDMRLCIFPVITAIVDPPQGGTDNPHPRLPSSPEQYAVISCKLKQNANEDCNSYASLAGLVSCFIACFILRDRSFITPNFHGVILWSKGGQIKKKWL